MDQLHDQFTDTASQKEASKEVGCQIIMDGA